MLATPAQAAVPDSRLLDTHGRSHALYRTPNATQIALIAGNPASPGVGPFEQERGLTPDEKRALGRGRVLRRLRSLGHPPALPRRYPEADPGRRFLHLPDALRHHRGKHFRCTAHYPDGRVEPLLSVPANYFDWQTQFRYQQPKPLPKGTRIVCEGGFDNSTANPFSPNPDATVRFGDQTCEEMFIGYLEFAADPDKHDRMLEKRRERMQQEHREFRSAQPPVSSDPPLTPGELLGTLWEAGQFKFRFLAGGVCVVSELIKGTYRVENNRVYIDVVGEHFERDIIGKGLCFNGRDAITRLECPPAKPGVLWQAAPCR